MKISKDTVFLIVGLGLMGGSYARGLKKQGYTVNAITLEQSSIDFALENKIIDAGSIKPDKELICSADIVVFALYPHILTEWIGDNQHLLKSGTIITDVTGVKTGIVDDIQSVLRDDVEFIAAHPMAGREVYGVQNSDEKIFLNANYIVVPTPKNTAHAISVCEEIGRILGFSQVSRLTPEKHDEMIAFLSQLTHCIAICLMTCNQDENLAHYTGDSFRDLTRIANINEDMWSELFLLNKDKLVDMMMLFRNDFDLLMKYIKNQDSESIKNMMRISTQRRKLFNKKETDKS